MRRCGGSPAGGLDGGGDELPAVGRHVGGLAFAHQIKMEAAAARRTGLDFNTEQVVDVVDDPALLERATGLVGGLVEHHAPGGEQGLPPSARRKVTFVDE